MESEAQKRSNLRWRKRHRRKNQFYVYRSMTKRFINEYAQGRDLEKVILMARNKEMALEKE